MLLEHFLKISMTPLTNGEGQVVRMLETDISNRQRASVVIIDWPVGLGDSGTDCYNGNRRFDSHSDIHPACMGIQA